MISAEERIEEAVVLLNDLKRDLKKVSDAIPAEQYTRQIDTIVATLEEGW